MGEFSVTVVVAVKADDERIAREAVKQIIGREEYNEQPNGAMVYCVTESDAEVIES